MNTKFLGAFFSLCLITGCTKIERLPEFSQVLSLSNGCALKFSSEGNISWLSISREGDISYKSNDRKMTTDPDHKGAVQIKTKSYENGYRIIVISKSNGGDFPVGLIPEKSLNAISEDCQISIK